MFADSDAVSLGFSPNCDPSKNCEEKSTQSIDFIGIHKDVQTKSVHNIEVQTMDDNINDRVTYDENRLAKFLKDICPKVLKELDSGRRQSKAFSLNSLAPEEDRVVEKVLTLYWDKSGNISVSALSWSCTGHVIAVGFSHALHSSWCCHIGHVVLYNVEKDCKTPICCMEVTSCVRSVCMHPYLSSVVAAGTYSGEVLVWDFGHEDSPKTFNNSSGSSHDDSITQLRWVPGPATAIALVSSALDGHLIFWNVYPQLFSYQMFERFNCGKLSGEAGVRSFDFPKNKDDRFVAALEGGTLVHGLITSAKHTFNVPDALKDPVINKFCVQPATAMSIEFSPFHEDMFATTSTDQAIRIYTLLNSEVQRVIFGGEGTIGVTWCLFQEDLLAAWGHQAFLKLYSSESGNSLAIYALNYEMENKIQIAAASFSKKSANTVAIGSLEGMVSIWNIPPRITKR